MEPLVGQLIPITNDDNNNTIENRKQVFGNIVNYIDFLNFRINKEMLEYYDKKETWTNTINQSLLHIFNDIDIIKMLLKYKLDVNKQDIFGNTPLHVHSNDKEIVNLLLANGADDRIKNNNGRFYFEKISRYENAIIHL
jgi:ankyrin repeat protein